MAKSNHNINEVGENVAVLITEVKNLAKNFEEFKCDSKKFNESIDDRVTTTEIQQGKLETRTSNLAIFQSVFSLIIGAIATYLGVQTKH